MHTHMVSCPFGSQGLCVLTCVAALIKVLLIMACPNQVTNAGSSSTELLSCLAVHFEGNGSVWARYRHQVELTLTVPVSHLHSCSLCVYLCVPF